MEVETPQQPDLEIPDFKPHIKEEHVDSLEKLKPFEREILLELSVVSQKLDFSLKCLQDGNQFMGILKSDMGALREEQLRRGAQMDSVLKIQKFMKWVGISFGTAVIGALGVAFVSGVLHL